MPGSTLIAALQPVRPGDLIEADTFNKLIAAVKELDQRGGTQPAPSGERHKFVIEEVALGDHDGERADLIVNGIGLTPSRLSRYFINGEEVKGRAKGSDTEITVTVAVEDGANMIRDVEPAEREEVGLPIRTPTTRKLIVLTLMTKAGDTASGAFPAK